ncbi:acetylglutamate kinase [Kitasatospora sp. NPDC088134]|uniref:acetylglutamate kinase n=1 Tax=Kitasatospora sp. NPDC088134 TaxID=3364071 RepID=UPI00383038B1
MDGAAIEGGRRTVVQPQAQEPDLLDWLAGLGARRGSAVVVKFGGNAMVDEELKASFARSVVLLRYAGLRPVVVHGGGPQIDAHLRRLGLSAPFAGGLRVTTPEVMGEVRMVLAGRVQRELVNLVNVHGPFAVGLTGEDAGTLRAVKRRCLVGGEPVDLGRVGEVAEVRTGLLRALLADGRIPVLSSVAVGDDGAVYNVNADTAAAAVAGALGARTLLMLTDVPGLYRSWPPGGGADGEVIGELPAAELAALLPGLAGGMVPKMTACLAALRAGVGEVRVLDGREPDAVLRAFGADAPGTRVVADPVLRGAGGPLSGGRGQKPWPGRGLNLTQPPVVRQVRQA